MQERTVKKYCALCGLCAVLVLLVVPDTIEEHDVELSGTLEKVSTARGVTFLQLVPDTPLNIISFDPLSLHAGEHIRVTGTLKKYNGAVEIVAVKVE